MSGSTMTSPSLSSTSSTGIGLLRDLSLGREDSADSCEERSGMKKAASDGITETGISSKIREKLASKSSTFSSHQSSPTESELLQKFEHAAAENGFECLSTKCYSTDSPLTYRCSQKHTITTREFFKTGILTCPKCQRKLDRCIEYAKAHNGNDCEREKST